MIAGIIAIMMVSGCQTTQPGITRQETIISIIAAEIRDDLPMSDSHEDELSSCLLGDIHEKDGETREAINQYLSVGRSRRIEGPWEITIYARLRAALCYISIHEDQAAIDILKQVISCRTIAVGPDCNWSRDTNNVTRMTSSSMIGEIDLRYRTYAEVLLVALGENLTEIYQSMNNSMATRRLAFLRGEHPEQSQHTGGRDR